MRVRYRAVAVATLFVAAGMVAQDQPAADVAPRQVTSRELLPLERRALVVELSAGSQEDRRARLEMAPHGRRSGEWEITLEGRRRTNVREDPRRGIVIMSEEFLDRRQMVGFDPPVVLVPPVLEPGMDQTSRSRATLYRLEDGSLAGTGTATHRVREQGWSWIRTPAGERRVFMVRIDQTLSLGGATVETTVLSGYEPGLGRVYQWRSTTTRRAGEFGETMVESLRLAEAPGGPR